ELSVNTTFIRGIKAVEGRFLMEREVPLTSEVIDSASAIAQGTAAFEVNIDGLVAVSPRSTGEAAAVTLLGGAPIDISGFNIAANAPRVENSEGECPELEDWQIDTGCIDVSLSSGNLDDLPLVG